MNQKWQKKDTKIRYFHIEELEKTEKCSRVCILAFEDGGAILFTKEGNNIPVRYFGETIDLTSIQGS